MKKWFSFLKKEKETQSLEILRRAADTAWEVYEEAQERSAPERRAWFEANSAYRLQKEKEEALEKERYEKWRKQNDSL